MISKRLPSHHISRRTFIAARFHPLQTQRYLKTLDPKTQAILQTFHNCKINKTQRFERLLLPCRSLREHKRNMQCTTIISPQNPKPDPPSKKRSGPLPTRIRHLRPLSVDNMVDRGIRPPIQPHRNHMVHIQPVCTRRRRANRVLKLDIRRCEIGVDA